MVPWGMTWFLSAGLWIDRNIRRPCALIMLSIPVFLLLGFLGWGFAWTLAAACACISLPPIALMFLLVGLHRVIMNMKRRRKNRQDD